MATKSIGGTDGMHFPGNGGFGNARGKKATSKFAHGEGLYSGPAKGGAVQVGIDRRKKPMKGSGKA